MKIKDRLAIYFTLISSLMLLAVLYAVYFTFQKYLETDFYARLNDRARVTAKLYLEADEISAESLSAVRRQYLDTLSGEVIRIYNSKNSAAFIGDDEQYWSNRIINRVRNEKQVEFKEGKRQTVGIFYTDNQGDFVILASAIDQSTHNRISKLKDIMAVIFVLILLLLLLLGRWIANRLLKPLDRFIKEVKQVKSSTLDFRVQEGKNKDELFLLAQTFNGLMDHLEQAFILQRTFVANASHELRTPVTRMMMGAEITLSQLRPAEAYQQALQSVMEEAENMDKIISGLVNLAQADLALGTLQLAPVRLDELLWETTEEWARHEKERKLSVEMANLPDDASLLVVQANRILLKIAVNNLVSNAFKFSSRSDVVARLLIAEGSLRIEITDIGIGIAAAEQSLIFQPFYTKSADNQANGHGMGLYMARKIVHLFKGDISLESTVGIGSTFTISLPRG